MASPTLSPGPVSTLTAPPGMPASTARSARRSTVSGVTDGGLMMQVLPVIRAAASFHATMSVGKFHGVMRPTTPRGSLTVIGVRPGSHRQRVARERPADAREVLEGVGALREVEVHGLADGRAVLRRFERREFFRVCGEQSRQPQERLGALADRPGRPVQTGGLCGRDGLVDVGGCALGHRGDDLPGRGVDDVEGLAARTVDLLAPDERLILLDACCHCHSPYPHSSTQVMRPSRATKG